MAFTNATTNDLDLREYDPDKPDPDDWIRYAHYYLNDRFYALAAHVQPPQGAIRGPVKIAYFRTKALPKQTGYVQVSWAEEWEKQRKRKEEEADWKIIKNANVVKLAERDSRRKAKGSKQRKAKVRESVLHDVWFKRRDSVDDRSLPPIHNQDPRERAIEDIFVAGWSGPWDRISQGDEPDSKTLEKLRESTDFVYDWPNDDLTILRQGTIEPKAIRLFSNYTAVRALYRVLCTEWRLKPVESKCITIDGSLKGIQLKLWAAVKTRWSKDGKLFHVNAAYESDYPVRATFKKNESGSWQHVNSVLFLDAIDGPEKEYMLYIREYDKAPPHLFVCSITADGRNGWFELVTSPGGIKPILRPDMKTALRRVHVENKLDEELGSHMGAGRWVFVRQLNPPKRVGFDQHSINLYNCVTSTGVLIDRIAVKVLKSKGDDPRRGKELPTDHPLHRIQQAYRQ